MNHTCGNCRFLVDIPPTSKGDISSPEEVRCGKYGTHKIYSLNEVNDCMEWEPNS